MSQARAGRCTSRTATRSASALLGSFALPPPCSARPTRAQRLLQATRARQSTASIFLTLPRTHLKRRSRGGQWLRRPAAFLHRQRRCLLQRQPLRLGTPSRTHQPTRCRVSSCRRHANQRLLLPHGRATSRYTRCSRRWRQRNQRHQRRHLHLHLSRGRWRPLQRLPSRLQRQFRQVRQRLQEQLELQELLVLREMQELQERQKRQLPTWRTSSTR